MKISLFIKEKLTTRKTYILILFTLTLLFSVVFSLPTKAAPQPQGATILPSVELYAFQPAVLVSASNPNMQAVPIYGAVYNTTFNGIISVTPNGPTQTACPIYLYSDTSPRSISVGGFNTTIYVKVPSGTPKGNYNCGLQYSAYCGSINVSKGNQVNVPYTVKIKLN